MALLNDSLSIGFITFFKLILKTIFSICPSSFLKKVFLLCNSYSFYIYLSIVLSFLPWNKASKSNFFYIIWQLSVCKCYRSEIFLSLGSILGKWQWCFLLILREDFLSLYLKTFKEKELADFMLVHNILLFDLSSGCLFYLLKDILCFFFIKFILY